MCIRDRGICVTLLPSSGMSATMNAVDIKNWGWRSILTGIIRRKRIKESCGIDSFRPRQLRRPASSWIKPGNHFMPLKRPAGSKLSLIHIWKKRSGNRIFFLDFRFDHLPLYHRSGNQEPDFSGICVKTGIGVHRSSGAGTSGDPLSDGAFKNEADERKRYV